MNEKFHVHSCFFVIDKIFILYYSSGSGTEFEVVSFKSGSSSGREEASEEPPCELSVGGVMGPISEFDDVVSVGLETLLVLGFDSVLVTGFDAVPLLFSVSSGTGVY